MRIIVYLIAILIVNTSSGVMADCNKVRALQWKYAPYVQTRSGKITKFTHPTEPRPTTVEEFTAICNDYTFYKLRVDTIDKIKEAGLSRIQTIDDSIITLGGAVRYAKILGLLRSLGVTLTTNETLIINIAQAGRDALVFIKTATNAEVIAYDVVNDPSWP